MPSDYKQLTKFLVELGIEQVPHTHKSYLGHLVAVFKLMESEGLDDELCRAGMFHSIYGTERFQGFKLTVDRRAELEAMIGARAERLAYWNCFMDRTTLDRQLGETKDEYVLKNRVTGEAMTLTRAEFDDLCRVHLYDWLEQVPRSDFGWNYRRAAYCQMVDRLGEPARQAYQTVFAREPATQAT